MNFSFVTLSRSLILTAIAFALTSCGSFSKKNEVLATPAAPSIQWYKVKDTPPSYFPKGLAKNSPTSSYHGFWVNAGENHSLYFVPKNGIKGASANQLQQSALTQQTANQKIKAERIVKKSKRLDFYNKVTSGSLGILSGFLKASSWLR